MRLRRSVAQVPKTLQEGRTASTAEAMLGRVKELEADVMSVAEAIENIKMIDHDFYVFRDQDTREVQIIYKRHDVGYGLLIPNL